MKATLGMARSTEISKLSVQLAKTLFRLRKDFTKCSTINPDDVVLNYSKRNLTRQEKGILARGWNFSIPLRRLCLADFLTPFEILLKESLLINNLKRILNGNIGSMPLPLF